MNIQKIILFMVAAFAAFSINAAAQPVSMDFVTVGNPNNAADTTGWGSVGYTYKIGKYDVTLNQYCAFLNAVAKTDPYNLYVNNMHWTGVGAPPNQNSPYWGTVSGITQSGSPGSYTYSVIGNSGNHPASLISWYSAARFCNWMQNGQPTTGVEDNTTTEQGTYGLDGIMSSGSSISINPNAKYWIPSVSEWYKAAYYDPSLNSGQGGYWACATMSNGIAGNTPGQPGINMGIFIGPPAVIWTWGGSWGYDGLTDVGAYPSPSAYGTYDQQGDVYQWTSTNDGALMYLGGVGFNDAVAAHGSSAYIAASNPQELDSDYQVGFRVATTQVTDIAPWVTADTASNTLSQYGTTFTVSFTAAAGGDPAPTIQWQVSTTGTGGSFTNVTGNATATTGTLILTNVTIASNGYSYRALFTNDAGSATSTPVTMTNNLAPTLVVAPVNQTALTGGTAHFSVIVAAYPPPTYQWQMSNTGTGGPFNNVTPNGTAATLTESVTPDKNGRAYRVIITNSLGSITTTPVTLTVFSLQTFDAFRATYGLTNPDPLADPNYIKIPQLTAYAFGINPNAPDRSKLPLASIQNGYLQVSFSEWAAAPDLTYVVEVSNDLKTWYTGTGFTQQVSVTPIDSTRNQVVVRNSMPTSYSPFCFIRVKLVH